MKRKLTFLDYIVVELVPITQCSEFRSRKLCKFTEVQSVNSEADQVQYESSDYEAAGMPQCWESSTHFHLDWISRLERLDC